MFFGGCVNINWSLHLIPNVVHGNLSCNWVKIGPIGGNYCDIFFVFFLGGGGGGGRAATCPSLACVIY